MKALKYFSAMLTIAALCTVFASSDATAQCLTLTIDNQNAANAAVVTIDSNCGTFTYFVPAGTTITPFFAGCGINFADINGTTVWPCGVTPLPAPFSGASVTCDFDTNCVIKFM